jgi:hypothetical protein
MCTETKLTSNWHSRANTLSLLLLPAFVFVIRDTVHHPRHRSSSETFFARKICSWTGALVNRGSTVLMKCGLETLNRSWNHSRTSEEVQTPHAPQNFYDCNQRSSKWWCLLMITEESSWPREFHVEEVWQQHFIVTGCKNCTAECIKTDLTCSGIGHSFLQQCMSTPGKGCDWFAK